MSNNLNVLTVATDSEGYFPVLKRQMDSNEINYKVLGYGEKWKGWIWRTNKMIRHLKKNYLPDDIIMIIDAYDVLFCGDKESIMKKYRSFNTDVVFGVELNDSQEFSFPISYISFPLIELYFGANGYYMLNGGSYMGTVQSIIKILEKIRDYSKETGITDDQYALNNISLDDIDHKLDKKAEIFWIWHPNGTYELANFMIMHRYPDMGHNLNIENERVIFTNGVKPEIIHGIGHRDMSIILGPDNDFKPKRRPIAQKELYYITYFFMGLIILILLIIIYLIYRLTYVSVDTD
jgi:hypothetical protein